jgi:opacity protein-like surface antigen
VLCQGADHVPDQTASGGTAYGADISPSTPATQTRPPTAGEKPPVASEITLEGLGSFGHYHIFADSWWSDLYWAGVEYDRHSWGNFLKAQMDYVAEVQPVVILRQPSNTDVWGDPLSTDRELVPGIGIVPIGLRMMWRSGAKCKPYFVAKGGMVGFTKKALSRDGSYVNLSLQFGIGMQVHLKDRLDMRLGYSDFHFSDAFIVPSNPGLDVMSYTAGLTYHLGKRAH